ncbi:MAG: C69 family dipeptidase [Haliscomenobacter sp.]|nr:C69 family dipeptidase [Haliscomenobacter sp.]
MCDTFVSMPGHSLSGNVIFGKNSDREPDEAQAILRVPALRQEARSVRCTFISIPQAAETFEVILSKPFQMWGAEMGVNEHGLAIGNEAVFTKMPLAKKNTGLTGMDMLRLALERCRTADQALGQIVQLLADFGQDACGGYRNQRFFYSNSFLIADPEEAWVLETAGPFWAAQKVRSGFRSISNALTIGEDFDLIHDKAIDYAKNKGGSKKGRPFRFSDAFSDWFYTRMGRGRIRQARTAGLGSACSGALNVHEALCMLSTHYPEGESFTPTRCNTASVCMHATGLTNPSNTTGSMVAEIRRKAPHTVWLTGTSFPCLSVWKPFFLGPGYAGTWEKDLPLPGAAPDESLWWSAENVHRKIARQYQKRKPLIGEDRSRLQGALLEEEGILIRNGGDPGACSRFSEKAFRDCEALLFNWRNRLENKKQNRGFGTI